MGATQRGDSVGLSGGVAFLASARAEVHRKADLSMSRCRMDFFDKPVAEKVAPRYYEEDAEGNPKSRERTYWGTEVVSWELMERRSPCVTQLDHLETALMKALTPCADIARDTMGLKRPSLYHRWVQQHVPQSCAHMRPAILFFCRFTLGSKYGCDDCGT